MKAATITGVAGIFAAIGAYGVQTGAVSQDTLAKLTAAGGSSSTAPVTTTPVSTTPSIPTPISSATVPTTRIGVNLGAPSYYSWEFAFADIIKNNGVLFLEKDGSYLTTQVPMTSDGRPYNVPLNTAIIVPIGEGPYQPAGTYNCTISPGWAVSGTFSLQNKVSQTGTTFTFTIPAKPADWPNFKLRLLATVNNASLQTLGCARKDLPASTTFNPVFLNDMKSFGVVRFMDWMQTNNNPAGTWAARPTTNQFSQIGKGVALEHMVDLANQLDTDPWLNIPYAADDDYVRKFAVYVRDNLSAKHKVYIEYSNEMWNTGFYAAQEAIKLGKPLYKDSSGDFQSGDYWYCDRTRQIMAIFSEVFAAQPKRLVRVLGVQAVWPLRAERMLQHNDTWKSIDVVASAPYFNSDVQGLAKGATRVNGLFANATADVDAAISWAAETKKVANKYGVNYVAYEGGHHYFSWDSTANTDIATALNDPRMYDVYKRFLTKWQQQVGGALVLYSGTGTGVFPMLQYSGQPLAESPRMRAVQDFIKTLPTNK